MGCLEQANLGTESRLRVAERREWGVTASGQGFFPGVMECSKTVARQHNTNAPQLLTCLLQSEQVPIDKDSTQQSC